MYRVHPPESKKTTQTLTKEEAREFENFQRGRGGHVLPFMKALPIAFSDQPYLPGIPKQKRTMYTEPPLSKKARREAKAKKDQHRTPKPPST